MIVLRCSGQSVLLVTQNGSVDQWGAIAGEQAPPCNDEGGAIGTP